MTFDVPEVGPPVCVNCRLPLSQCMCYGGRGSYAAPAVQEAQRPRREKPNVPKRTAHFAQYLVEPQVDKVPLGDEPGVKPEAARAWRWLFEVEGRSRFRLFSDRAGSIADPREPERGLALLLWTAVTTIKADTFLEDQFERAVAGVHVDFEIKKAEARFDRTDTKEFKDAVRELQASLREADESRLAAERMMRRLLDKQAAKAGSRDDVIASDEFKELARKREEASKRAVEAVEKARARMKPIIRKKVEGSK